MNKQLSFALMPYKDYCEVSINDTDTQEVIEFYPSTVQEGYIKMIELLNNNIDINKIFVFNKEDGCNYNLMNNVQQYLNDNLTKKHFLEIGLIIQSPKQELYNGHNE